TAITPPVMVMTVTPVPATVVAVGRIVVPCPVIRIIVVIVIVIITTMPQGLADQNAADDAGRDPAAPMTVTGFRLSACCCCRNNERHEERRSPDHYLSHVVLHASGPRTPAGCRWFR